VSAATEGELRAVLSGAAFARQYDFRLGAVGDGQCTIEVPFQPGLERPGGVVAGPVFMAAADVAMWLAVLTRLGARDGAVTSQLTTTFVGAARRLDFRCTARVLNVGRRLVHGAAECVTLDGRLLTHHTVTYYRTDRQ
jgi:uncharacterized protein (TIGR00369 family)